jgi:hypothetical protein
MSGFGPSVRSPSFAIQARNGIFVAGKPDADLLALEVRRPADAAVAAAGELQPGMLEDLRDVHERRALVSHRKCRRHPIDRDIGLAAASTSDGVMSGRRAGSSHPTPPAVKALCLRDVKTRPIAHRPAISLQDQRIGGLGRAHRPKQQTANAAKKVLSTSSLPYPTGVLK